MSRRRLIERQGNSPRCPPPAFLELARQLSTSWLLRPRAPSPAADRVLISPDGPLHSLPFAALVRTSGESGRAARGSIWWSGNRCTRRYRRRSTRSSRRHPASDAGPATLIAFGDPQYPGARRWRRAASATPNCAAMLRRGYTLDAVARDAGRSRGVGASLRRPRHDLPRCGRNRRAREVDRQRPDTSISPRTACSMRAPRSTRRLL